MPRRPSPRPKTALIQIAIEPDDKKAFDVWCEANATTMSDVIREHIAPYIAQGKELLAKQRSPEE